ncbi:hypothetical protein [Arthrobacter russicus]|uniref:Uncharacterized protein n=1 Tax=Arthrobacter russicus TaxID=172040 RepID=A0ABU1JDL4_9MICC|nr:hypothetical protein [Arthrobacter russicus]MDR6270495.1 hypothetical protein [Arthrobacter russicus]
MSEQSEATIAAEFRQPREIIDAASRALRVIGADPAEAQLGALAAVRAEAAGQEGLKWLAEILATPWNPQKAPPTVEVAEYPDTRIYELKALGQPALRTMLELIDLASEGLGDVALAGRLFIAYTEQECVAGPLWDELLLRQAAQLQRAVVLLGSARTTVPAIRTMARRTEGNAVVVESGLRADLAEVVPPHLFMPCVTAFIVLPGSAEPAAELVPIPARPLPIRDEDWQNIQRIAGKFLVVGA